MQNRGSDIDIFSHKFWLKKISAGFWGLVGINLVFYGVFVFKARFEIGMMLIILGLLVVWRVWPALSGVILGFLTLFFLLILLLTYGLDVNNIQYM